MIDPGTFQRGWARLEERWGEKSGADAYHTYLSERLTTEEFTLACRALWATREFFPRPADFLHVSAGAEWRVTIRAIELHSPPQVSGWSVLHAEANPRSREAVQSLGGLPALVSEYQRSPVRARQVWLEAYESSVMDDAMQRLPGAYLGPALPPGAGRGVEPVE